MSRASAAKVVLGLLFVQLCSSSAVAQQNIYDAHDCETPFPACSSCFPAKEWGTYISLPESFDYAFDGDDVSVIGSLCIADALG